MIHNSVDGRDVYAGDVAVIGSNDVSCSSVYEFKIEGDADPDVLARVCNLVSLTNILPRCCQMERIENSRVVIRIEIDGITGLRANSIRRKLEQLTSITGVKVGEQPVAP